MKVLESKLNLDPPKESKTEVVKAIPRDEKRNVEFEVPDDIDADFELARQNTKRLLLDGEQALDGILDLAQSGEHPRAYEVAGQLIKTLMDANKDLLDLHKRRKEYKKVDQERPPAAAPREVHNTVFVGSTNALQKMIKDRAAKDIPDGSD